MDATVDHLRATWSTQALLEHYGWTYSHTDRHGRTLMTRPGKDEGVSASINANERVCVFSTSTPLEPASGTPATTHDRLDIIAAYEYHGDRKAAARDIATRAGILNTAPPAAAIAPPNVDPETGEIVDDFWNARESLARIQQAARSRYVAPSGLLGCVLAEVAAYTPPSTCLPPTIGVTAPLSLLVALYGTSGAGKSAVVGVGVELMDLHHPDVIGPLGVGSGEGLVELYQEYVDEKDDNGKVTKVKRQTKRGAFLTMDEGGMLKEMASRKGATIMPVLRTAWSGADPGTANASLETRRSLQRGNYSLGMISAWQDKAAQFLLGDADGGTPQRFIWFSSNDPEACRGHDWPGRMGWTPPDRYTMHVPFQLHPDIIEEITDLRIAAVRGEIDLDPLDAHRNLNKLKVAGCLALLDGRSRSIDTEDWRLAEYVMANSDSIRSWVIQKATIAVQEAARASAERQADRELIVADKITSKALTSAARAAWRATRRAVDGGGTATRRDVQVAMSGRDRKVVSVDEAITEAERLQWVKAVGEDALTIGTAAPT